MPEYKLTYFNCKALGESIRFLFAYGDIEFEDKRIEERDWAAVKPTMPLKQMPILEFSGIKAIQSIAINRYVARLVGLTGETFQEDLLIDGVVDTISDMRTKISDVYYEENFEVKEGKLEPLETETIPFYMSKLESFVKDGHLVLGKLTWADVYFAGVIDYLNYIWLRLYECKITEGYPALQSVVENVLKIENIAKWVAKRPHTEY